MIFTIFIEIGPFKSNPKYARDGNLNQQDSCVSTCGHFPYLPIWLNMVHARKYLPF